MFHCFSKENSYISQLFLLEKLVRVFNAENSVWVAILNRKIGLKISFGLYIGANEVFWKNFREWKRTVKTIFYHLEMVKIKKNKVFEKTFIK